MRRLIFTASALAFASSAYASLEGAQNSGVFGKWKVLRSIDKMTDKVECTGVYDGAPSTQLGANALYISVRGGIESLTLRFGDEPAKPMRLPSSIEKRAGVALLQGAEFEGAVSTTRLRGQAATLLRNLFEFDYDMTGTQEALAHIRNGCPLPAKDSVAVSAAPEPKEPPLCGQELRGRMQAAGVTRKQIEKICAQ